MGWAVIISWRPVPLPLLLIPWTHQAQNNPNAPSGLTAAIVGGLIALEWEYPTQHAASIPGTPQVGETLTADIPKVVDAHALNHAAFTGHRAVGAAANAGIPDATGTARSLSDEVEDHGRPTKAPAPFTDNQDDQETLARATVAYLLGPRRAPPDPNVEAGARDQSGLAAARSWRPGAGTAAPSSNPGRQSEAAWQRTASTSQSGHCRRPRKPAAEPETSIRTGAGRSSMSEAKLHFPSSPSGPSHGTVPFRRCPCAPDPWPVPGSGAINSDADRPRQEDHPPADISRTR